MDQKDNGFSQRPKRVVSPTKSRGFDNLMSTEEQRMIKLALKNSIIEAKQCSANLDDIEEMKTFHPTLEEFKNPIEYVEKLYKEGAD